MTEGSGSARLFGLSSERWSLLSSVATVVGILFAIFGIFEYVSNVESERSKITLEEIEDWEEGCVGASFRWLRDRARNRIEMANAAGVFFNELDERERANFRQGLVRHALVPMPPDQVEPDESGCTPGLDPDADLTRVLRFLNRLGLCVDAGLCSTRTTAIYFAEPLVGFIDIFGREIERSPHQIDGIVRLVSRLDLRCPDPRSDAALRRHWRHGLTIAKPSPLAPCG